MKKSELRQIIKEELTILLKNKNTLTEGFHEDIVAQRKMFSDYESSRTRKRFPVKEATTPLKKGAKVKDYMGGSYVVLDFGPWNKVAKYDSTGAGRESYKMFGNSRVYVAVKALDGDMKGDVYVYTHGDDGVE